MAGDILAPIVVFREYVLRDILPPFGDLNERALLHLRPCVSAEHHIGVRSNCPLWTMCMNSIPIRTRRALENLLNPSIGWMRDLIRR